MCGHRRTAILMHAQSSRFDAMAADRLGEQLLGQRTVLPTRNHPSNHIAAVQIEHYVQAQKHPSGPRCQLGYVPTPHHVRRIGHKPWHRMVSLGSLHASFTRFTGLSKQSMHGTNRAQITSLVEQLGVDLRRRLIGKARLVQHLEYRLALGLTEPTNIAAARSVLCLRPALDVSIQRCPWHS